MKVIEFLDNYTSEELNKLAEEEIKKLDKK